MIVDVIGDIWDLSEQVKQVQNAAEDIVININSPGGYCSEGLNLINAIQKCPYKTTAHVSVEACSMAAVIAVACNRVEVEDTAVLMFHNCMSLMFGNKEQCQPEMDAMAAIDTIIHGIIQKDCTDQNFGERIDAGEVWLLADDAAELFAHVEKVPVQKQQNRPAAIGGFSALVAAYNTTRAKVTKSEPEPEPTPEPEPAPAPYVVPSDLKKLMHEIDTADLERLLSEIDKAR